MISRLPEQAILSRIPCPTVVPPATSTELPSTKSVINGVLTLVARVSSHMAVKAAALL
jgi:hypothetical protein